MQDYGTIHLFGINGTISEATITDTNFEDVCANVASVLDEMGNKIQNRGDDLTTTGTVTLIIRDAFTPPEPFDTFSNWDGETYLVTRVGRKFSNRGFNIVELSVEKSENIDYTA
jgi:hypothetical protein